MSDFLLEVGVEEIPDWMIEPALDHLRTQVEALVKPLGGSIVLTEATPRRLALKAANLAAREEDREELVTGPPKAANAQAVAGFAKKQGIDPSVLAVVQTARGEFHGYTKKIPGRDAAALLAAALPEVILGIPWPKTMFWTSKGGPKFIRPLRWVVCLLGDEVVPFEIAGIATGNQSGGHRKLGAARFAVTVDDYEQKLAANGVILKGEQRKQKIRGEIVSLIAKKGFRVKPDSGLEKTLTYITEFPTAILGSFDPSYLQLPSEVLVTVMRFHQKYFSVEDAAGKLAPHFIAVMNISADPEGLVVHGNERVLRARFNDARFFYDTDQKRPLEKRYEDLASVTFHAKLGSYIEKIVRMNALAGVLGLKSDDVDNAIRLSKCDLTTEMVKEFTELQGQIGGVYARAQGHSETVAQAIYDHYKPVSMDDDIPRTKTGQVVSLVDKLDTLREFFRIGLAPKGSSDPFALRRAAQGLIRIWVEGDLTVSVRDAAGGDLNLQEFFRDRVEYYFKEIRGFAYDEVRAVLGSLTPWFDLKSVASRLEAVRTVRSLEDFEPLATSFKRIRNIFEKIPKGEKATVEAVPINPLLFTPVEQSLFGQFERARASANDNHVESLKKFAALRQAVDDFFDGVMVNDSNNDLRLNRLALLREIYWEVSRVADLSEIVTT